MNTKTPKQDDEQVNDSAVSADSADDTSRAQSDVDSKNVTVEEDSDEKPPISVREAIRKAIEQHETEDKDNSEKPDKPDKARDDKGKFVSKEDKEDQSDTSVDNNTTEEVEDEQENNDDTSTTPNDNLIAPVSWSKEAKAEFDKLPSHVRQAVAKRETEMSDGIQQYSRRIKDIEPLERVIAPRLKDIQAFGTTPAETVDRLFRWMEALTGPNKVQEYQRLGQAFGISVPRSNSQDEGDDNNIDTNNPDYIPPQLQNALGQIINEVNTLKNQNQVAAKSAADNFINTWAADKPYYQKVRPVMHALITSGAVPLTVGPDGKPDITHETLTKAYEQAIYADASIRAEMSQKQEAERKAKEAKAKAEAEKKRKEQLEKAKKASISVKSGAPASVQSNAKPKGNTPTLSVRDTIRNAVAAARE